MSLFRQETKAVIRRRIGYLLFGREFIYGAITAVTGNTITLAEAARFPEDTFTGKIVHCLGNGEKLSVTASEQGTGELTLVPSFVSPPSVATYAEVWPETTTPEEVDNAINRAIDDASDVAPVKVTGSISSFAVDRKSFSVSATWTHLSAVNWEVSGYPERLTPVLNRGLLDPYSLKYQYAVEGSTVYLNRPIPSSVATVHVMGYRQALLLDDDTDVCEVRSDYVIYKAAALLQMDELGTVSNDPDAHSQRATGWLQQAVDVRVRMRPRFDPNTVALE